MAFFNDFATGFFKSGADKYAATNKRQEELDKIKAEQLAAVDAKKQLMDYEAKVKREQAQISLQNIKNMMTAGAINQTPDAVVNAPKAVEATAVPIPTGQIDDNAQPFPASEPIDASMAPATEQMPTTPTQAPAAPQPTPMNTQAGNDTEMQAQLAMASHLSENPTDEAGALLKYQEVKTKGVKDSIPYRTELAKMEAEAKTKGEISAKNAGIEPVKAQAKIARSAGIPAPTDTGYFNKSPDLRDKMDLEDNKLLNSFADGSTELGKKYINSVSAQASLMAAAQLQPDVNTGGIIWGSQALNDLRTRFDPEADAFKGIVTKLGIEQAKQVYPVSNTDMALIQKTSPALEGTEEGNLAKIQIAVLSNQAVIEQFNFFNAYKNKWGTLDGVSAGFAKYMKENPLLDADKSEGINFVANDKRISIDEYLNGVKPAPKETAKPTETKALAIPTVSDAASYDAIPKGQQYKDPQGNIRTKK